MREGMALGLAQCVLPDAATAVGTRPAAMLSSVGGKRLRNKCRESDVLSGTATIRFLASFGNVFLSLILGVIAMGFFWVYYPAEFNSTIRVAAVVREWIIARVWSPRAESILRFMLEDRQLLLMGFVLTVRFLLGLGVLLSIVIAQRLKALVVGDEVGPQASVAGPKDR